MEGNEDIKELCDVLFFSKGRLHFGLVLYIYLVVFPLSLISLLIRTIKYKIFKK